MSPLSPQQEGFSLLHRQTHPHDALGWAEQFSFLVRIFNKYQASGLQRHQKEHWESLFSYNLVLKDQ